MSIPAGWHWVLKGTERQMRNAVLAVLFCFLISGRRAQKKSMMVGFGHDGRDRVDCQYRSVAGAVMSSVRLGG